MRSSIHLLLAVGFLLCSCLGSEYLMEEEYPGAGEVPRGEFRSQPLYFEGVGVDPDWRVVADSIGNRFELVMVEHSPVSREYVHPSLQGEAWTWRFRVDDRTVQLKVYQKKCVLADGQEYPVRCVLELGYERYDGCGNVRFSRNEKGPMKGP